MQDNIIYRIGSLRIKINRSISHFNEIYSISFLDEYDWYFEIIESKEALSNLIQEVEETGNKDNIIYINDNCIYKVDVSKRKTTCFCKKVREFEVSLIGAPIQVVALNSNKVCLHGSGIINNNKIVLFSGNSGVGKSTLMNYLIDKGYEFFCDDMCLLDRTKDVSKVYGIEGYFKLYEEQIGDIDGCIEASEGKYFVPIEKNGMIKKNNQDSYKLERIIFLSRKSSSIFENKKIFEPSFKYILCAQGIIFFNEDTPLISDLARRNAINLIKDLDIEVLYIPDKLENYDIDLIKKIICS